MLILEAVVFTQPLENQIWKRLFKQTLLNSFVNFALEAVISRTAFNLLLHLFL